MDIPFTHISVGGDLSNPDVLIAFSIWLSVIALLTVSWLWTIRHYFGPHGLPKGFWPGTLVLLGLVSLVSIECCWHIALVVQTARFGKYIDTTWWGYPPIWPVPVSAVSVGIVAWWFFYRLKAA